MKPDPCPAHIDPTEWKVFLRLLEMHKARATAAVERAYLEATKRRRG